MFEGLGAWLVLVCGCYACTGLMISFLCWRDDPESRDWRLPDWVAAIAASPLVVLEFWIETLRQK